MMRVWGDPPEEGLATHSSVPGESHGQRSLVGCSPWGYSESDTTEAVEHARTHKKCYVIFYISKK